MREVANGVDGEAMPDGPPILDYGHKARRKSAVPVLGILCCGLLAIAGLLIAEFGVWGLAMAFKLGTERQTDLLIFAATECLAIAFGALSFRWLRSARRAISAARG